MHAGFSLQVRMKERGLLAQAILCLSASNGLLIATPGIPVVTVVCTYNASAFAEKHGIMRAIYVMIGKRALVCRYCHVGKDCFSALRGSGTRGFIAECDSICTLQACMEGLQVATIESVVFRSTWLAWRAWKG